MCVPSFINNNNENSNSSNGKVDDISFPQNSLNSTQTDIILNEINQYENENKNENEYEQEKKYENKHESHNKNYNINGIHSTDGDVREMEENQPVSKGYMIVFGGSSHNQEVS